MTTKEKLEKALEALKEIAYTQIEFPGAYAADVYEELTTPRTKEVEVKRWECKACGKVYRKLPESCSYMSGDYFCNGTTFTELIGRDARPIPEPETWEGKVFCSHKDGGWLKGLPNEWIGRSVVVEVCE